MKDSDGLKLNGLRVLLVEDEPDVRDMFEAILRRAGARVQSAGSALDAFKIADNFEPEFILSDLGLPEEDGYSFIRKIRANKRWGRIPAVALTAFAKPEDRVRVLSAGFQCHLAKPVDPAELLALIVSLSRSTLRE